MANRKKEKTSKKRSLYLQEKLFEEFSEIAKNNGKSASQIFDSYMQKIVNTSKNKELQDVEKSINETILEIGRLMNKLESLNILLTKKKGEVKNV